MKTSKPTNNKHYTLFGHVYSIEIFEVKTLLTYTQAEMVKQMFLAIHNTSHRIFT